MSELFGFLHFLISAVILLFVLTVGCIVAVSLMPKDNPLHALLSALTHKLAVTLGLAMVAPIVQILPLADIGFDIGAPLYLIYTWCGFIKTALADKSLGRRQGGSAVNRHAEEIEVLPAQPRRIGHQRQSQAEPPEDVESTF